MKTRNCTILALALLALGAATTECCAQSIYTPYAFTNFAGLPGVPGTNDGVGSGARLSPQGSTGSVAMDTNGNVYVADDNHTIRKITPAGEVTTLAGSAGQSGSNDGTESAARFHNPYGVAVDTDGNVYVADGNHTIRKITPAGDVTTLAGSAGQSGSTDGTGSAARSYYPVGVAVGIGGNVYVADTYNRTIRKITSAGEVTVLAGRAGQIGSTDGTGSAARFNYPTGVAVDSTGNVYVAESGTSTIRKITPAAVVTTLAGSTGQRGYADGIACVARFTHASGVAVDSAGNLFVADASRITKGTPLDFPLPEFDTCSLRVANDFFLMRLNGPSGSNVVVEASANLQTWTPVQTNALPPGGLDVSVPLGTNQHQFLRALLTP